MTASLWLMASISAGLVAIGAVPLRIRLEADKEFDVEEAGGIRAVIGAAEFRGDGGDFRK